MDEAARHWHVQEIAHHPAPARDTGRTAVFFGLQTPMLIEDDLGLVITLHDLGIRSMQLT